VSYMQFHQKCSDCGEEWNAAFGIVGMTQIAAPPIRDMRKARFGGFTVEHRCIGQGVWEYRVLSHSAGVAQ